MMHVTILGKRWKLRFTKSVPRGCDGEYDDPATKRKEIRIKETLDEATSLETIVHEILHAADFWKREEWVQTVGSDLARILWKLGYRRKEVESCPARKERLSGKGPRSGE